MFQKSHWRQLLAALFANLPSFTYGIAIGWTSVILPRLQTEESPLGVRLTLDEASWVGSIYLLSGTFSSMMYGWLADRFGRKVTILVAAASQLACWVILEFGTNVAAVLVARFLVGFGAAGSYVTVPMYVTEISSPKIRGSLGALIIVMVNLGLVAGYIMNSYLDYFTVPYILIGIFAVFYVGYGLTPETPKFYAMKADFVSAKRSLQYFRGYDRSDAELSSDFEAELNLLRSLNSQGKGVEKLRWQDFCTKSARKAILIGVFVNFLAIMSGMVAVTNYSDTIFIESGSDLSPAMSSIIIGLILLIGATSSSLLSDRAGRRILMSVSSIGCGLILTLLAIYSYLKSNGYSLESAAWMPLVCLSAFMLLSSMGITALHYLIMSEVLAQNIRGAICTLCAFENWLLAFTLVKCFPLMLTAVGMEGCMLFFALVCFSGTLFVAFVLPETKGKPIEAIIKELEGNQKREYFS